MTTSPQIPREVWGIWDNEESRLIRHIEFDCESANNVSIGYGQPRSQPVLIGGSALLEENEKLRRVAEAAVAYCSKQGVYVAAELVPLLNALEAAGYPKAEGMETPQ